MKTSWVLGSMGLLLGACATTPAPQPALPVASAALPVAAPSAPAPSGTVEAPPTAPTPAAKSCAEVKDVETCEAACLAAEAGACMLLAQLYAQTPAESGAIPGRIRAWSRACQQGEKAGCDQRDSELSKLRASCKRSAKDCGALGEVLGVLDEPSFQEMDASFERGCGAGDIEACEARARVHRDLEPRKPHVLAAEKSLDRACALGSLNACCSLIHLYGDEGDEKKQDAAYNRFQALNGKAEGRLACDSGVRHFSRVVVTAKADPASVVALGKEKTALLEESLARRVADCVTQPPPPARIELELMADGAAKLTRFSGDDADHCVAGVVAQIRMPPAGALKAAFDLSFAPKKPRK